MRVFILSVIFCLLFCCPAFSGDQPDILPKKGDVTKNIHIVFDKSCSMSQSDFERGYAEVQAIAMQGTDEFNLAVSVFAAGTLRMQVNDKDCALGKNWMAMPSAIHYKNIMSWLDSANIPMLGTQLRFSIRNILKENKKNVTVIVISDCIIGDIATSLNILRDETSLKAKKRKHPIKIGFVDTDRTPVNTGIYELFKKRGCWYVVLDRKKEEEEEIEEEDE